MNVDQPVCSFLADRFQFVHSFLKTRERLYVFVSDKRTKSRRRSYTHPRILTLATAARMGHPTVWDPYAKTKTGCRRGHRHSAISYGKGQRW